MPELRATVRLQLHAGFDLHAAAAQVPYYQRLGVSHLYLSPIARARPGSTHGYDVIDPGVVCPERGGEAGLRALGAALRDHGMGAILDIVPNHMAADARNPWWWDVLRHGRHSRYARHFDIDWDSPASPGRVWLPWLTAPLSEVLARGELRVEPRDGETLLVHDDWTLPLAMHDTPPEACANAAALRQLLCRQPYRLAWWRSSSDAVNYRRFFDIDGLVALDMTCDEAFDAVHALPLRWLAEGLVDGLRIDHVDGLADPRAYLSRLREAMDAAVAPRADAMRPSLHVEKILRGDEQLPTDWPTDGTTGYEMMDRIGAVLHDPLSAPALRRSWRSLSGRTTSFMLEERLARRQWLHRGLHADFTRCMRALQDCLASAPEHGDYTPAALERACADVLAELPVYRSYTVGAAPSTQDARMLAQAFDAADVHGHPDGADLRHWLRSLLLGRGEGDAMPSERVAQARRRFEQLSAPLAAKAVEDTAFYRYGVWLSRNEVGSDPARFAMDADSFHHDMEQRATIAPRALTATATHDHKRGEDVRARLAALSEMPARWTNALARWMPRLHATAPVLAKGDLAMLLQTVVGAWPLDAASDGEAAYKERIQRWWIKALREARLHTHWTSPQVAYESAATELVRRLFDANELADVRHDVHRLARELDTAGALNGLVSVTLRHTLPGVPDLYQGCDYWDLSLVDPDNRAPVDYEARHRSLSVEASTSERLERFRDGAIKQVLIQRLLAARHAMPQVFGQGDYQPWLAQGAASDHVLAFARRHGDNALLVAVPRHCMRWMSAATVPRVPAVAWQGTRLPALPGSWRYRSALSSEAVTPDDEGGWPVSTLFAEWPVAVLHAQPEDS
ncbi:maltooligosyl trehalose synthase [Dyella jiangningensis]|uniref:malto-oligosyltrehalose synthase n=1 Tax=Dyella sp. AtDHG13 TaxID=1938897 RepID=UPI00088F3AF2|nr:malto-oligosyltrehalose synthase [Dyella sp. AtDHG13]PXV55872.1 maltooligosyl trehalose synthase [Dyella sp. AtDHG13]SDK52878.1 maltooligosyl trehalose synthase [Dyella jiangningensis]